MKYNVYFSETARTQLVALSENAVELKKIDRIIEELKDHPYTGTGKPEKLKYIPKIWSRRLDKKKRICYTIEEGKILVIVVSLIGHYRDK